MANRREPEDEGPAAPARRPAALEGQASRSTTIAIGAVALVAITFAVWRAPKKPPEPPPTVSESPGSASSTNPADRLTNAIKELEALPPLEAPDMSKISAALEGVHASDKGFRLPNGQLPPPLPADAPKAVRFGVVLVRYRGAQLAPESAPTRDEAKTRADALAAMARTDFPAAVKGGDHGSALDVGTIHRGVLEPATQYVLFSLPVGGTSEVLDTPRGFWIVRRIR